jgi:hypothetical protein
MQTGHPTSGGESHNSIRRSTVMPLASASEEAPPRYTSVTSRLRRKRREVTIGSPPKTTTNTRSTISASTTRVVVTTQRAHHPRLSEARPNLASWPSPVKLLKTRHNPERMTVNGDHLPPPRSDGLRESKSLLHRSRQVIAIADGGWLSNRSENEPIR